MRKIVLIVATVMSLGAITIAASRDAEARFGAGTIAVAAAGLSSAQPAQYYGYDRRYVAPPPSAPPTYAPPSYAPRYSAPRYRTPPPYRDLTTRDALDTCAAC
jgi:hypothetical protein